MKRLSVISWMLISILTLSACREQVIEIKVSSIALNSAALSLTEGESYKLNATVSPDNASDKSIIWSSSDAGIASVEDGMVTAVKEGSAVITAASKDGGASATCPVTVSARNIPVESITLNMNELVMRAGNTYSLTATVKPDDATDKKVTWTTNNPSVATVEDGLVTAVGKGAASITATAGGKNASCTVTVKEATIHVTSVTLDQTSLSILVDESATLTATVKPDDATDKTVTWESSDTKVLTVYGGKVTGVSAGTATVKATADGVSATCEVQVTARIPVEKVTLDCKTLTLSLGQTDTLMATVFPENATDKTVTWDSSDDDVVSVRNGIINGVSLGKAIVTATAGEKSASCSVTVKAVEVDSITLDRTSLSLNPKEEEKLTVTFHPANATDKTVTWTSSDETVATVLDGTVRAIATGMATITAKSGNATATCEVRVNNDNYLTISNLTNAEGTLTLKANGTSTPAITLEYSTDNGHTWIELKEIKTTQTITIPSRGSVRLCGENPSYFTSLGSKQSWWSLSADVIHSVSGDLMTISSDSEEIHSKYAFYKFFNGDTKLKSAQSLKLSATIMSDRCYELMFEGCTSLEKAPVISAATLATACFKSMFQGCEALTDAPKLTAMTMKSYCYDSMFEDCTALKTAPDLPADKLAQSCYAEMFKDCTSLEKAPALPAISMEGLCYNSMFMNCSSLKDAPRMSARVLALGCFTAMFHSCISLEKAPDLPATRLQEKCYYQMFANCQALTEAPKLPATTLANGCYSYMFSLCKSLKDAPVLPAETLAKNCYEQMFAGCSSLCNITCLATDISAANCTAGWTGNVEAEGIFTKSPKMENWLSGPSGIPIGWTVEDYAEANDTDESNNQ